MLRYATILSLGMLFNPAPLLAQVDAQWLQPLVGQWHDASNWSTPDVPNGSEYQVTIAAAGAPYTVSSTQHVNLSSVTIDSPDATLEIAGGTFNGGFGIHVENGTLQLNGGRLFWTSLSNGPGGTLRLGAPSSTILERVTLAGELRAQLEVRTSDTFTFDNGTLYAADGFIGGSVLGSGDWILLSISNCANNACRLDYDGSPNIEIAEGVTIRSAGRRVSMYESSNLETALLINRGTLAAQTSGGYWYIERLRNEGLIRVSNGDRFFAGFYGNVGQLELGPGGTLEVLGTPHFNLPTTIDGATLVLAASGGATTVQPLQLGNGSVYLSHGASGVPIDSTGGTVFLSAAVTPAQLAAMPITGPAIVRFAGNSFSFNGQLNLEGGVFDYTSTGYNWEFSQGLIRNGTLTGPDTPIHLGGQPGTNQSFRFTDLQIEIPLHIDGTLQLYGISSLNKPVMIDGGTLSLYDTWTNAGGITVNSGVLHLLSSQPDLGDIAMTAGELRIGYSLTLTEALALPVGTPDRVFFQSTGPLATLDLEGATLDLQTSRFAWGVGSPGGSVTNGTIMGDPTGEMLVLRGGRLDDLSLDSVRLSGSGILDGVTGSDVWMDSGSVIQTSLTDSRIDGLVNAPYSTQTGPALTFMGRLELNGRLEGSHRSSSAVPYPHFQFGAGASLTGIGQIGNTTGRIQSTIVEIVDPQFTIPAGITLISATQYDSTDVIEAPGTDLRVEGRIVAGFETQWCCASDSWTFRVASLHTLGEVEITRDGQLFVEGGPWRHAGHLNITGGTIVANEMIVETPGVINGWGTLEVGAAALTIEGRLAPGTPQGQLAVTGDVVFTPDATLAIDLRGRDNNDPAAPQYDQLQITGEASLAGLLDVTLAPEFFSGSFAVGDQFEVLTATAVSGEFDALSVNVDHIGFELLYSPTSVILQLAEIIEMAGDYNHDGAVDAADYVSWRDSLGASGTGLHIDGDGSGIVDPGDYVVWRSNFGSTAMAAEVASITIPEPTTAFLALLACLLGNWVRWR